MKLFVSHSIVSRHLLDMKRATFLSLFAVLGFVACNDDGQVLVPPDSGSDAHADGSTSDASTDGDATVTDAADASDAWSDASDAADAQLDCGDGGLVACGTKCVDLKADQQNCGFCGHDCGTGTCTAGKCPVETLATGRNNPMAIAVDGTSFYVLDDGTQPDALDGALVKCPKSGCPSSVTPMTSSLLNPQFITFDATNVYWLNRDQPFSKSGSLMACPTSGCGVNDASRVTLVDGVGFPGGLAVDSSKLYFGDWGGPPTFSGSISSCAITGCNNLPDQVMNAYKPTSLAIDGTNVYSITNMSYVWSAPLGQSTAGTQIEHKLGADYRSIQVYGGLLYWGDALNGVIDVCPASTCNMNSTAIVTNQQTPIALAVDAKGMYWIDDTAGTLMFCALSGCNDSPIPLADGLTDYPTALALDAQYVYWTNQGQTDNAGTVMRVLR